MNQSVDPSICLNSKPRLRIPWSALESIFTMLWKVQLPLSPVSLWYVAWPHSFLCYFLIISVSADDYIPSPPVSLSSLAAKSHPLEIHSSPPEPDTTHPPTNAVKEGSSEEDAEEFVDAVEDMPTPMSPAQTTQLEDNLQDLRIEEPVPLKRSNSNFSLFSLPPNATWDHSSEEAASTDPLAKSLTVSTHGRAGNRIRSIFFFFGIYSFCND